MARRQGLAGDEAARRAVKKSRGLRYPLAFVLMLLAQRRAFVDRAPLLDFEC